MEYEGVWISEGHKYYAQWCQSELQIFVQFNKVSVIGDVS